MYGVVLLVALGASAPVPGAVLVPGAFEPWSGPFPHLGPAPGPAAVPGAGCYGGFTGCPAPLHVTIPPGLPGGMIPLGPGQPSLAGEELQLWQKYVGFLGSADRRRVEGTWAEADSRRRRDLVAEAHKLIQKVEDERKALTSRTDRVAPAGLDGEDPPLQMLPPAPEMASTLPPRPARLVVHVPPGATLSINGHATRPGGDASQRVFDSPPLEPGRTYEYTLQARYFQGGSPVLVVRTVIVRAGQTSRVSLTAPTAFRTP